MGMGFSIHPFAFINCYVLRYCAVSSNWVSVSVHPARRSAAGITRDAGHHSRLCKLVAARRRCTRYWRRAPCLWARGARRPLTQGPRSVLRTRLVDPMTGISRRATVKPLQRSTGAVQDRTARDGLKARRADRRSCLRSARHFASSLRTAR